MKNAIGLLKTIDKPAFMSIIYVTYRAMLTVLTYRIGDFMLDKLKEARRMINEIDREMAELFVKRMRAAEIVAAYKGENGLPILDEAREEELIKVNSTYIEDEVLLEYYVSFIKSNMEISRRYQSRLLEGMKVAYCGTVGAYAHLAARKHFPYSTQVAYPSFSAAYEAVVNGECDVAVLPVENSFQGDVGQVTDLMFSGNLYVNSMFDMAISHDLLAPVGATLEDIRTVVSHPQALGQCRDLITERGYATIEYSNTALAAEYVANKGDKTVGAIASEEASEIFGLAVLERNINSARNNTTRFAVFSRVMNQHSSKEMGVCSIILFTVRNEAGALARAIEIIGRHGFNMRSLRSRPMKELLWQYYFYVEAEGNINTDEGRAMLEELELHCDRLSAVGTFTKREI